MSAIRGQQAGHRFRERGIDYDLSDAFISPGDRAGNSRTEPSSSNARDAVAAATRNNVSIYTVDPRGISPAGSVDAELATQSGGSRSTGADPFAFERVFSTSQGGLRTLADETGGFAAVGTNDFAGAFDRIVQENSSYYVLSATRPTSGAMGIRSIVRVRGRDDLRVIHRRGYAASREPAAGASTGRPPIAIGSPRSDRSADSPLPVSSDHACDGHPD